MIATATKAASEKAAEVQNIIGAWSDAPADLERSPVNTALLEAVRNSETLQRVVKYSGHFRGNRRTSQFLGDEVVRSILVR